MRNLWFILFIGVFPFAAHADREFQYQSLTAVNLTWYEANSAEMNRLLINGSVGDVVPIINTLGMLWTFRDGAVGSIVARSLALSFIHQTHLTFLWFDRHPKAFDDWVVELPDVLLTDYEGSQYSSLKLLREELLTSVDKYINSEAPSNLKILAGKLTNKLNMTHVEVID